MECEKPDCGHIGIESGNFSISPCDIGEIPLDPPLRKGEGLML